MNTVKPTAVARRAAQIVQAARAVGLCPPRMAATPERVKTASIAVVTRPPLFNLQGF